MSKRNRDDGLESGSDSFLDIIANIVGILIILIVIAGMRVSRAPVTTSKPEIAPLETEQPETAPPQLIADTKREVIAPPPPIIPEPIEPLVQQDNLPPIPLPVLEPTKPPIEIAKLQPSPELLARIAQAKAQLEALREAETVRENQLRSAVLQAGAMKRRIAELDSVAASNSQLLTASTENFTATNRQSAQLEKQLEELQTAIRGIEAEEPDVKTLEHRVTPLARTVAGDELHYHLLGGRVTVIPFNEIVAVFMGRLGRQKAWLADYKEHRGVIGPMGGFKMHYVAGVLNKSVVNDLTYGGTRIAVGLKEWRLEPEENLPSESAAEAVLENSHFRRSLLTTPQDTTLTFWVYPDSFELFRKLQATAQDRGLMVAGRPLPHGIPIVGSRHGTRSSGQ